MEVGREINISSSAPHSRPPMRCAPTWPRGTDTEYFLKRETAFLVDRRRNNHMQNFIDPCPRKINHGGPTMKPIFSMVQTFPTAYRSIYPVS